MSLTPLQRLCTARIWDSPSHNIPPHHLYLIKGVSGKSQIWPVHNRSNGVGDILLLNTRKKSGFWIHKVWFFFQIRQPKNVVDCCTIASWLLSKVCYQASTPNLQTTSSKVWKNHDYKLHLQKLKKNWHFLCAQLTVWEKREIQISFDKKTGKETTTLRDR